MDVEQDAVRVVFSNHDNLRRQAVITPIDQAFRDNAEELSKWCDHLVATLRVVIIARYSEKTNSIMIIQSNNVGCRPETFHYVVLEESNENFT